MKSIMKAVLFLLILFFTNQSSTQDLTSIFNSIGKSVFDHLMEINVKEYENEKNENKNEKNIPNEQNPIFGPYEIDLIGEVLVSIVKCKTITDRLYSLDLGLEYNISYILNKTEEILGSKKFDSILIGIFTKINIFDFEAWLKLIRGIIEIMAELPAISEIQILKYFIFSILLSLNFNNMLNEEKMFSNFKNIKNIANFKMLECIYLLFDKKVIIKNSSNYMTIFLINLFFCKL